MSEMRGLQSLCGSCVYVRGIRKIPPPQQSSEKNVSCRRVASSISTSALKGRTSLGLEPRILGSSKMTHYRGGSPKYAGTQGSSWGFLLTFLCDQEWGGPGVSTWRFTVSNNPMHKCTRTSRQVCFGGPGGCPVGMNEGSPPMQ